ncbi:RHS repeat-associated core domain-containing protein [Xanthomonas sp. BRIP62415]|uniref:RHS repeat domain-containing protein n=1 Tax=Xanthomonas sp. BRIP62415 TaxID=2182390 RepID=UPI000F8CA51A|nr:RHS repeat-associated core domain-containing protein [Xanthomonas sp. BRIP62415]
MSETTKTVSRWLYTLLTCMFSLSFSSVASAQVIRYVHTDGLGSTSVLTDTNRNVIERREYEPYGANLGSPTDVVGYTGHVMDAATGLTYMQQRYYDPQVGLFLSADPIGAKDAEDTRLFNRYVYAFGNPYKFKDIDGRCPFCYMLNLRQELISKADRIDSASNATSDAVDFKFEAAAALGVGLEGSISLKNFEGQIGFIPVGIGADVNVSGQPKEGFKINIVDKQMDSKIEFSGGVSIKGGAIVHPGVDVNFDPGGSVEVVPKAGVGLGEMAKFSPVINFFEWGPLREKEINQ